MDKRKNLTGKGKYIIKSVDQALKMLVQRIKDKSVKETITTLSKKM